MIPRVTVAAVVAAAAIAGGGCAAVRPWEREHMASPAMQAGFVDPGFDRLYRAKVLESRTAGGLPGSAPGGGCGCTQ
jgi:hypothetical protein